MKGSKLASAFITHDESTIYWTDGVRVYFRHYEIKGADIDTFEHFPGCWAKDKKHCYLTKTRLQGADAETFEVLNYTYAKDKAGVWTMGGRIPEADCDTFEVCDGGKKSLGKDVTRLENGQIILRELFVPYGYAKDKNNVYYYDYQGKTKLVRKALVTSFVSCGDSYFGYDEKSVFCGAVTLPKAKPATWAKLKEGYYYSVDGNMVFYFNRLMKDADAQTFEVLAIPSITGDPSQLAKDKNHFYWNDTIESKEDIDEQIGRMLEYNRKVEEQLKVGAS